MSLTSSCSSPGAANDGDITREVVEVAAARGTDDDRVVAATAVDRDSSGDAKIADHPDRIVIGPAPDGKGVDVGRRPREVGAGVQGTAWLASRSGNGRVIHLDCQVAANVLDGDGDLIDNPVQPSSCRFMSKTRL